MSDYALAERVAIDARMEALVYVLERVKAAYGSEEIALRNVASLVDAVADAVMRDDRTSALVEGMRLLNEIEVITLWGMLEEAARPAPPDS